MKERNGNKDFTLIARDCIGGVLYHQLGLRFLSPTINLFFSLEDFNCFCLDLKGYIDGRLEESKDEVLPYPVGVLYPAKGKPIKIHFMHYETFDSAKAKWQERKQRIRYDNLFVVSSCCYSTEVETLTPQIIEEWNKIPYKKVILVDKKYGFDDEAVIEKPNGCEEFAWLLFAPDRNEPWRRTFNDFDFIGFLNKR